MANKAGNGKWRSKWKRSAPERRAGAAASLADVFARRARVNTILLVLLILSAAGHALTAMLLPGPAGRDVAGGVSAEDSYLQKIMQKERAKDVSKKMVGAITMPPPPPDPKSVVNNVLSEAISTDIDRTIGSLLDVDVTSKLTAQVTASLKDELAAAAETIAAGRLSEDEIRKLQDEFKSKAQQRTVQALQQHREETQVQRAQLSVKEWYETRLSKTLKQRMDEELFTHENRAFWSRVWCFWNGWGWLEGETLSRRAGSLGSLSRGQHYDPTDRIGGTPTEHGMRMLPDWPKYTEANAAGLLAVLKGLSGGGEGSPAFDATMKRYVDDYHPHRRPAAAEKVARVEELWKQALAAAEAYAAKVAAAPEAERQAARDGCLKTIGELSKAVSALLVDGQAGGQLAAANQAVRSRVLRGPKREEVYERLVEAVCKLFEAPIRDVAENEFREGIIIRRDGVEEARAKFTAEILTMLRRDVREVIPKPRFDDLVFTTYYPHSPYVSKVTGKEGPPTEQDIAADEARLEAVVKGWPEPEKAYLDARTKVIEDSFASAADRIAATLGERLIEEGRFSERFYASVESVDYTDKVQQRLEARRRAMEGRGQDLARLTDEGIPDTSAPLIALMFGASKGHGASLEPVVATMAPTYFGGEDPVLALAANPPVYPPRPTSWERITQHEPTPPFENYKCEGIPFMANFPDLDGSLKDWGAIRPLITQKIRWLSCPDQELMVYAAWNYQGYFFGWHVDQKEHLFCLPKDSVADHTGMVFQKASGYRWAYTGDNLRLLFDTLDARSALRGEPHAQEFVIFPRGTESNPNIPGIERIIRSQRDATRRRQEWGEIIAETKVFPPQPPEESGPDGTGPFRVTQFGKDGYTCEVFLPRSLFNVPVFAPGWYIGFETVVAIGEQPIGGNGGIWGRIWGNKVWNGHGELGDKDFPKDWGDLLMLGTDPQVTVQQARPGWPAARSITPGHSYLLTVIDPDRNVNLSAEDTVIVSAEVAGAGNGGGDDVEVYILKETGKNTSVFRGCINTQPGLGRQVQGVLEASAGQAVRFGYVDFGNAKGQRNVVYELRLPVAASVVNVVAASGN